MVQWKHSEPPTEGVFLKCKSKNHPKCKGKYVSEDDVKWHDGSKMRICWQPCTKEAARAYIHEFRAPKAGQAPQPQRPAQPQGPQDEEAGPSSSRAPATAGVPPVAQQQAGPPGGGSTTPGPSGQPVPSTGAQRPPGRKHIPSAVQWHPDDDDMVYEIPGPQHGDMGYPQGTAFPGEAFEGEFDEILDMDPNELFEGDDGMGFPEDLGAGEDMPFSTGPGGKPSGGDSWPGSTVPPLVEPPRARWVAHRSENLYHGEDTDGIAKSPPHTVQVSTYDEEGRVEYSKC